MKKDYMSKVIIVLLLIIIIGTFKYINDTNRLKYEIGNYYERTIVTLLRLHTNDLKAYLEENEMLDAEDLKAYSRSFEDASIDIGMYYGTEKIPVFYDYGINIRNKLNELTNLLDHDNTIEEQNQIKHELIVILSKGQDTWSYLKNEIKNTNVLIGEFQHKTYKKLHLPSKELVNKITEILPEFN